MRALLSVSDLTGLPAFAAGLRDLGWELFATDGTRRALRSEGVEARAVSELTGTESLLDGRVKTLHPQIHAAILARREKPEHLAELKQHDITPIDMVVVNLYRFADAVKAGIRGSELIDQIDIGGVALLRAAAKNHDGVIVVARADRYATVLEELRSGGVSHDLRSRLAAEAFAHTAAYDAQIATQLNAELGTLFPDELTIGLGKVRDLRYGENPHQSAAFYAVRGEQGAMPSLVQLHGRQTSFNNMLDLDTAWTITTDFPQPTVAIVKHQNPCGIASHDDVAEAYRSAFACDTVSAFGGILGVNRPVSPAFAEAMRETFYEAIVAAEYDEKALEILRERRNLEVLLVAGDDATRRRRAERKLFDYKRVAGGMLVQTPDEPLADQSSFRVVTERHPTLEELTDLLFAWRCVRHVKSNAIVLAKGLATVGIGPGQLSRVVAVEVAVRKAGERARLAVMASDAYFPFPDGIEVAARAGVTAIIQPGGSVRDQMMIETANRHRMAMLFTGRRHFRH